jgi:hypothetical protein
MAGWGDYNNDGFIDLLAGARGSFNMLYRNSPNGNHWLKIKLDGQVSNRAAIGAKVRVKAFIGGQEVSQMRVVQAQSSITEMIAHFGLGDATSVTTLRIEWPSGIVREYQQVAADQFLTLMENQAPIADASASQLLYISPNGLNATATLKGWRSSDPDGDALQYYWLATPGSQPANLLASGVEAVVVLPVGIHPLELVVSDGVVSATNALTVEVITTSMAMVRLIEEAQTEWRRSQPLVATLYAALHSIERGDSIPAINQLRAFQNKVKAQLGRRDPALAGSFIEMAQQIIDALTGGTTNPGSYLPARISVEAE